MRGATVLGGEALWSGLPGGGHQPIEEECCPEVTGWINQRLGLDPRGAATPKSLGEGGPGELLRAVGVRVRPR